MGGTYFSEGEGPGAWIRSLGLQAARRKRLRRLGRLGSVKFEIWQGKRRFSQANPVYRVGTVAPGQLSLNVFAFRAVPRAARTFSTWFVLTVFGISKTLICLSLCLPFSEFEIP
jgi:hypothetical protein